MNRERRKPVLSRLGAHPIVFFLLLSLAVHFVGLGIARLRQSRSAAVSTPSLRVEVFEIPDPGEEGREEAAALPPPAPPAEEAPPAPPAAALPPPPAAPPAPPRKEETAPLPEAPPAPALPPPTREEALQAYACCLAEAIERAVTFPPLASQMDLEGSVVVSFTLDRSGALRECYIPAGGESFFSAFNLEALRAVRAASFTFSSFPEGIDEESLTFRLPVSFVPSRPGK